MGAVKKVLAIGAGGAAVIVIASVAIGASGGSSTVTVKPVVAVSSAPATHSASPVVKSSPAPATTAPAVSAPSDPVATQAAPVLTGSQQQAVDSAQSYLSLGSGFSKAGLIKQLTSSYGEGFKQADATFAVSYLSPDWDAQAVMAAKGYMDLGSGFSRSGLIQQLTSPYGNQFTEAQAEYAAAKVGL